MFTSLTPADMNALIGFAISGALVGIVSASLRLLKEFGGIEVLF